MEFDAGQRNDRQVSTTDLDVCSGTRFPEVQVNTAKTEPGPLSGPTFKAIVMLALRRQLQTYRTDLHSRRPGISLNAVTIVAATPLDLSQGEIRSLIKIMELPTAEVRIAVHVDPLTTAPGFRIELHPTLKYQPHESGQNPLPTKVQHDLSPTDLPTQHAATEPTAPAVSYFAHTDCVLTLCFGEWEWTYPLVASEVWIPLGRGLVSGGRQSTVRIPDFMIAVPRGSLLRIQHLHGSTSLQRSTGRSEYIVSVDGQRLDTGRTARLSTAGSIDYEAATGAMTALRYTLTQEERDAGHG